jgi:hypothetical protein
MAGIEKITRQALRGREEGDGKPDRDEISI